MEQTDVVARVLTELIHQEKLCIESAKTASLMFVCAGREADKEFAQRVMQDAAIWLKAQDIVRKTQKESTP